MSIIQNVVLRPENTFMHILWETAGLLPEKTNRIMSNEQWSRRSALHSIYWILFVPFGIDTGIVHHASQSALPFLSFFESN